MLKVNGQQLLDELRLKRKHYVALWRTCLGRGYGSVIDRCRMGM